MNVLNKCNNLSIFIKTLSNYTSLSVREYSSKSDLKIKWVRPEFISCIKPEKSGDLGIDTKTKPTDFRNYYENVTELNNANDLVKKMFSLDFAPRKEKVSVQRERILDLVRRHKLDRGSHEAKIASMTNEILQLQEYMEIHPRNRQTKVFLKELIDKRKKYLNYLRTWDYKRFEWILEQLNLVYKPQPIDPTPPQRKASLRKLTQKHCDNIISQKLEAYKAELKQKQIIFYKEKAEKLAFIRSEEIACGVIPTVSEEDIAAAKTKAETLQNSH